MYERQAYLVGGRWRFFGGLPLGTVGGGRELISAHQRAAHQAGVWVRFAAPVTGLLREAGTVVGVAYEQNGTRREAPADAVVLAAGGFEASSDARARWLGEPWRRAIVRGTPYNTGEVLELAVAGGAARHGDWASCHSVAWDAGAPPDGGDRRLTNQLTRQSYPLGIVVNRHGRRFLDEGADFRNYTYARYGRDILGQPGSIAYQIFDSRTRPLLRAQEYDTHPISESVADSLEALAAAAGIDPAGLTDTVSEFNAAIIDRPFDPSRKDGKAALVQPPKSNWAVPLDTPPFYAYAVACGITFTFGGLHVDPQGRVLTDRAAIPGLFAAGEIVGGLFSTNYPGGSGLTAGSVLGRIAGQTAARSQRRHQPPSPRNPTQTGEEFHPP
jgi:tricarballylate dehydrogenase